MSDDKYLEKRREDFFKMYKETFGFYPEYTESNHYETIITLNIYGIKANI